MIDGMADMCGTLVRAAAVLNENGTKSVLALVTHGIVSGSAIETFNGSVLSALVVTNTVPLRDKVERVRLLLSRHEWNGGGGRFRPLARQHE